MPPRRGFPRLAVLGSGVLLGVWVAAELTAWAGLWWIEPDASIRGLRERREALSRPAEADAETPPEPVTVVHPYLGFVRNPDRRLDPVSGREPLTDSVANEYGFPDGPPLLQTRAPDRVVFAIVGGSLAMNFSETGIPFLRDVLQRSSHFADRELVFVRLAQGGYKQPQQLLTVTYLLSLGAAFDYVIALDGFNEVALHEGENAARSVFPAYPRNWAIRVTALPDPTTLALRGEILHLEQERARWAARFEGPLSGRSPVANLVWLYRDRRLERRRFEAESRLGRHQPDEDRYVATGPRVVGRAGRPYQELATVWRRSSIQLHRLCDANGARYFHFLQPNQYVAGSKQLTGEELRLAHDAEHPYRRGVVDGYPDLKREGEALRLEGVRFRDLTTLFGDVEETIYRDRCCHVNERGHQLLAEAIGTAILEDAAASPAP